MKIVLLAALLLALSSRLFALSATPHSLQGDPWLLFPSVLATKRATVTVMATPSPTQIVVHVPGKGDLLLTAYEPMRKRFSHGQVLGFEIDLLLHEASGRKDIGFRLIPPSGSAWQIPIKSAQFCVALSI
jgi:hypothetical protein